MSKDGHNGAGRHGAGLHSVPGVAASDMDSDTDQYCWKYFKLNMFTITLFINC
jgi:hypothetical protein